LTQPSIILIIFVFFLTSFARLANSAELLMIESESCEWCETWHEEVGLVYANTLEGKYAPLRRVDIADISSSSSINLRLPNFTPTFIVLDGGREVARIIGYPGEEFFWPMLIDALKKIGFKPKN